MSFAREYIGQAWVYGEHDCWAFFRKVQKEKFNREVPAVNVDALDTRACVRQFTSHNERKNWQEVKEPQNGDAILMSQSKRPTHVGVWVDGAVLHCVRGAGVVYSNMRALKSFPYNIVGIYRAI